MVIWSRWKLATWMVGAVSTLLSSTTAIWPVGQVADGGLHWAAAALNLSMPSAPSLKIGRISHWPFWFEAGRGRLDRRAADRDRAELVDRDDLAGLGVDLGDDHVLGLAGVAVEHVLGGELAGSVDWVCGRRPRPRRSRRVDGGRAGVGIDRGGRGLRGAVVSVWAPSALSPSTRPEARLAGGRRPRRGGGRWPTGRRAVVSVEPSWRRWCRCGVGVTGGRDVRRRRVDRAAPGGTAARRSGRPA